MAKTVNMPEEIENEYFNEVVLEMKRKKSVLIGNIGSLISKFEKETGMKVSKLSKDEENGNIDIEITL